MLTEQRRRLLLDRLGREGRLVATELSRDLDLSEDTIRRDLRELAEAGLLQRVHGGALPASPTIANLAARRTMAVAEKCRLGQAGAGLLRSGQTLFIDGGTTNLELVRALPVDFAATVITHSPAIAAAFEAHTAVRVIVIGGSLLRHSMVAVGAVALDSILRIRADLCVVGLTGLHAEEGATTGDYEEAAVKRAMIERAAETMTLLTAEKIGAVSPCLVCRTGAITTLLVPAEADCTGLAEAGLRIERV
jgi:DeoR/GlpR family transcriptional regulator of sugar metabolism